MELQNDAKTAAHTGFQITNILYTGTEGVECQYYNQIITLTKYKLEDVFNIIMICFASAFKQSNKI